MINAKYEKQAKQIIKLAEEKGVQGNFLFVTTFDRYLFLLDTLEDLKQKVKEEGTTIEREYIKGEKNTYSSPNIKNYNVSADLANKTVQTLMKIIDKFNVSDKKNKNDPLVNILNGVGTRE